MAASAWTYLGFEWNGKLHVFTCLHFGLAQAPRVFIRVRVTVYKLPRSLSWPPVSMVNDAAITARTHAHAHWRMQCVAWPLAALGLVYSVDKCTLWSV